jgi:hypothetical protein
MVTNVNRTMGRLQRRHRLRLGGASPLCSLVRAAVRLGFAGGLAGAFFFGGGFPLASGLATPFTMAASLM